MRATLRLTLAGRALDWLTVSNCLLTYSTATHDRARENHAQGRCLSLSMGSGSIYRSRKVVADAAGRNLLTLALEGMFSKSSGACDSSHEENRRAKRAVNSAGTGARGLLRRQRLLFSAVPSCLVCFVALPLVARVSNLCAFLSGAAPI
jgi:hypothetical protein